MEVINPISQLASDLQAAYTRVADLTDSLSSAQQLYAAPGLHLQTNNGQGYEISVLPPPVPHDGQLALLHTPVGGEPQSISTMGEAQLPAGEVKAQWVFADGTSSEITVLTIS